MFFLVFSLLKQTKNLIMKKIYLCALALSVGSLSFGQALHQRIDFSSADLAPEIKSNEQVTNQKALGQVIYTNDFDTPADWTADNSGGPGGAAFGWTIDAVSDGWWSSAGISSVSGGNYAELSNGDPTQTPGTQAILTSPYTLTTTNSIDLIALGGVGAENSTLEFNQYGARFNDLTEIQISTDGSNFITVGDNFSFDVHSQSASNIWPNPSFKTVNLAPYLNATTAQTVWIRFSWTTNFPSQSTNPNVWVAYGWYIDDVKIRTNPTNDLVISEAYYGTAAFPYSRIPVNQIQPIDFTAKATNGGLADQTGTVLTADINSGSITQTSTPQTVVVGATDSLITTTWTPPVTTGVPYNLTLGLASDSVDDVPVDNAETFSPIEITEYIYAYDDYGTPSPGGGDDGSGNFEFEAGNWFDIWVADDLYAMEVVVGAGTVPGTAIEGVLYEIDANGDFIAMATTPFYTTTAGDINNVVNLIFPTPQTLNPNTTYFIAVHTFTEFYYGTSGSSPDGQGTASQTSLIFYPTMANPTTQYYSSSTPMVRMNFDPNIGIGVDEVANDVSFNVFPNPSAGEFNINLSSFDANNVNLTVKNVVGKTILNKTVAVSGNTVETISLSDYSKGVYFLTIDNETVKLIVE